MNAYTYAMILLRLTCSAFWVDVRLPLQDGAPRRSASSPRPTRSSRTSLLPPRAPFLSQDRFPDASGFLDAEPLTVADAFAPDAWTSVVVMTHNYLRDIDYLRSLLDCGLAYLGVLGPRRRTDQMLAELAAAGVEPTSADRDVLHAPAGLDLGAEGPEEVAWSIVAEMLAVHRGRGGGPLRDRTAPIHAPLGVQAAAATVPADE